MSFIDVEEDKNTICENIISDFLQKNNLDINMLKKEKNKLKEIVKLLKEKYNLSYGEIATKLKTNKTVIYRIEHLK